MNFGPQWGVQIAGAHSCHEVKTAFQLRQIGPLKWVPETAATGWFVSKLKNFYEEKCHRYKNILLVFSKQNLNTLCFCEIFGWFFCNILDRI